ncbi:MAG TPA: phosphatase PAP2 family protein [Saprospiraceae bacterium]|nr:phosphatase PAP2 family protein [Saprospiraceae bacterium]HRK79838.1 phosphatase PAP2 family protein [Saprospiraceae bacterium]
MSEIFMLETIQHWDQQVFELLNGQWQSPLLDWLAPLWRDKRFWIPLYLLLSIFVVRTYRKRGLYFLLALGLTAGISDVASSRIVKPSVQRLRPCNNPELRDDVHLLVHCGSGYSFTSSHAANHFAAAAFLFFTLGRLHRRGRGLWWLWAASIAYAQVYVGVHYPADILAGAVLGAAIGYLSSRLYLRLPNLSIASMNTNQRA